MNIYNDSNFSSQTSMPSTPTFSGITTSGITIPGSGTGDLLFIDSTQVDGLAIAPQNYVLQSSGTLPQWTNSLTVNTVTCNDIKINATSQGDLFTVGADTFLERIAKGSAGSIFMAGTGTDIGWVLLNNGRPIVLNNVLTTEASQYAYTSFVNITTNPLTLLYTLNFNVVNGRRYKLTISGRQQTVNGGAYSFKLAGQTISDFLIDGNADLCRNFIYTALTTGTILGEFFGNSTVAPATSLVELSFILEPFV